jgi:predicted HAD superfamily Cof-like phosphohydrolase
MLKHEFLPAGLRDGAGNYTQRPGCTCGADMPKGIRTTVSGWFRVHVSEDPEPLADTAAVADFMKMSGQTVRTSPTTDITAEERLLRARLVLEEALEFVEAMGCEAYGGGIDFAPPLDAKNLDVRIVESRNIDLVEAADAIGDIVVVAKGSAHTLGIDPDHVFRIIHETNLAKAPGGVVTRNEFGKILKPEGWVGPTEAIRAYVGDV